MAWYTEGEKASPASGTLLADTGQIIGGTVQVKVAVSAEVAASALLQHRNDDNTLTLKQFKVRVMANETRFLDLSSLPTSEGDRVRLISDGVIVGEVQALLAVE